MASHKKIEYAIFDMDGTPYAKSVSLSLTSSVTIDPRRSDDRFGACLHRCHQ